MHIHKNVIVIILITRLGIPMKDVKGEINNANIDMVQLARKYGYPCENHTLVTPDGYILQMERIPIINKNLIGTNKLPVLLVPGLLSSSLIFAAFGPKRGLAFILADHGYDVWLLNYRGTTYSRKHVFLDADRDKKQYWNFSLQEIALYDIPTAIDYVLSTTRQESLFYIGNSLGSGVFFGLAAEHPEYNKKVRLMVAIGPALQSNNSQNPLFLYIAENQKYFQVFGDILEVYEVLPYSPFFQQLGKVFCSYGSLFRELCVKIYYFLFGYSPKQLDKAQIAVMLNSFPAGTSLNVLLHVAQFFKTGRLAWFDYGRTRNLALYGKVVPPVVNVSGITTPIAIFHGDRDALISCKDFEADLKMLPSVYAKYVLEGFNHADLIFGIDAPRLIFREIVGLLDSFGKR